MKLADPFKSCLNPRSQCDQCHRSLNIIQLIPVISSLILRLPCSFCDHRPRLIYGVIEGFIGIVFMINTFLWNIKGCLILQFYILLSLHISLWDWLRRKIPLFDLILLIGLTLFYSSNQAYLPISLLIMNALLGTLFLMWKTRGKNFPLALGDWLLLSITSCWIDVGCFPLFLMLIGLMGMISAILYQLFFRKIFFPFAPAILVALWLVLVINKL